MKIKQIVNNNVKHINVKMQIIHIIQIIYANNLKMNVQ